MTVRQKQGFIGISSAALLIVLVVSTGMVMPHQKARPAVRITLVARNMAFLRAGDLHANPTLALPAGKLVEIELHNIDTGSQHNLVIPELKIQSRMLKAGEKQILRFTTPAVGRLTYYCAVHPVMMRGEFTL